MIDYNKTTPSVSKYKTFKTSSRPGEKQLKLQHYVDEEMVVEVDATGIVLSLLVKFSQC
jgi:hypothetical protein